MLLTLYAQLCLHVEGANAIHLVSKEIDSKWIVTRERIDINDATSDGKLARFIDIIHSMETKAEQRLLDKRHIDTFATIKHQRLFTKSLAGDHSFGKRIRRCDEKERSVSCVNTTQYVGAQYLVTHIALAVFGSTAEATGKEEHIIIPQNLYQIMIEIASLLGIIQHKDKGCCQCLRHLYSQGCKNHRCSTGLKSR